MERTDHFLAQDHAWRRGQELRHPRGAVGGRAEGDSRSRQGHSLASGKTEWGDGRAEIYEKPAKPEGGQGAGKTPARSFLTNRDRLNPQKSLAFPGPMISVGTPLPWR